MVIFFVNQTLSNLYQIATRLYWLDNVLMEENSIYFCLSICLAIHITYTFMLSRNTSKT